MRTITKNLAARLEVQAKEAKILGMKKLASHLDRMSKASIRSDDSGYVYSESDMKNDVEKPLWDAILRVADYHNCNINADELGQQVEKIASYIVNIVEKQAGVRHGVGAYEPTVLGEEVEEDTIEVE